jgi:hypothetical protein
MNIEIAMSARLGTASETASLTRFAPARMTIDDLPLKVTGRSVAGSMPAPDVRIAT